MSFEIQQPDFGRRLRRLRTERGLSQRDLAGGLVSPSYVSLLESGARVPALEVAMRLAGTLGVPVGALVEQWDPTQLLDTSRSQATRLVQHLLARSAVDFGDLDQAGRRFTEAYELGRAAGDRVAMLEYGIALGDILNTSGDHARRYALLGELTPVAAELGVPELIVRICTDRAAAARDTGRFAEARTYANEAMDLIEQTAFFHQGHHVRLLSVLISILADSGQTEAIPQLVEEMLDVAAKTESPSLLGRAHWTASVAYGRIGDGDRVVEHVRQAAEMLGNPTTPVHDWARFSRGAASALLDANAPLAEVEAHVASARAGAQASRLQDDPLLVSLEVRYALARRDYQQAATLAASIGEGALSGFELVRFVLAKARASYHCGRPDEAIAGMRRAAGLAEEAGAYKLANQIWRELDEMRSH